MTAERETREYVPVGPVKIGPIPAPPAGAYPHVTTAIDGVPLIKGTNIPVSRIWHWYNKGVPAETLVKRYPQLGPAVIFCVLAFCYDHPDLAIKS